MAKQTLKQRKASDPRLKRLLYRRLRWAGFGKTRGRKTEFYPRAVLQHPEIPDALKVA